MSEKAICPSPDRSGAGGNPIATFAIETRELTKVFDGLTAVDRLDLEVRAGEVFGFLGPNGAGKTTTIKMMLGLTAPTSGHVRFDGLDVAEHGPEIKAAVGYLPERIAFYPNLTALQTLRFFAELKGADPAACAPLLENVGLTAFAETRVGTFSKGMTQLLGFAQALLGSPKVLILDEPTIGLDPRWSRTAKNHIREASKAGTTVFFSSHVLSEVQELADRVAILNHGKLVAQDTTEALGKRVSPRPRLRLRLDQDARKGEEAVRDMPGVAETEAHDHELVVHCEEEVMAKVVQRLLAVGFEVRGLKTEESSLEDVFLALTTESKRAVP